MADPVAAAAHRAGIPLWLMRALVGQESGGRQGAVSSAGAYGMAQLMPGTARRLEQSYGINTRTAAGNLLGGAYYLREQLDRFGSIPLALAAYNAGPSAVQKYDGIPPYAETQRYVRNIMSHKGAGAGAGVPSVTDSGAQPPATSVAPAFTQQDALMGGLGDLAAGRYNPVSMLRSLQRAGQATAAATASTGAMPSYAAPQAASGPWKRFVSLSSGADRAGVHTQPAVLQFVGMLGRRAGRSLAIGTGTNHSRMTVDGNVSNHWNGMAADIPATGSQLRQLGYLALIQAGMPRAEALRARRTGGLFNVGRYQVIFATHLGGDHTNHLHVGIR